MKDTVLVNEVDDSHVPAETLATAAAEAFTYFADARVRHYVPVLALKRASRQLSAGFDTRDDAGGAA
ncbi:three-helix bundle dimerization domain-containing protein [Streptomyces sp. NPDC001100]